MGIAEAESTGVAEEELTFLVVFLLDEVSSFV